MVATRPFLIVLPNKLVILEDKNSRCEVYKVYKDIMRYPNKDYGNDFNKSVVKQTTRAKTILGGIVHDLSIPIKTVE